MTEEVKTFTWQFELIWKLAQYHLPKLTDEASLWEPAATCWTVRKSVDGQWRPDWSDAEPDPAPAVTIGWLTWHLVWWWSSALAAARNEPVPERTSILWPGTVKATVERLEHLAQDWRTLLTQLTEPDLAQPVAYPWPQPRPLRLLLAWTNVELAKNIAEIGYARHLYEAN